MLQSPANKSAAKGEVDKDSDNEEAIERDVKDADSFSMNDLISRRAAPSASVLAGAGLRFGLVYERLN